MEVKKQQQQQKIPSDPKTRRRLRRPGGKVKKKRKEKKRRRRRASPGCPSTGSKDGGLNGWTARRRACIITASTESVSKSGSSHEPQDAQEEEGEEEEISFVVLPLRPAASSLCFPRRPLSACRWPLTELHTGLR